MGYMKHVAQMCTTKLELKANLEVLRATISMCERNKNGSAYFNGEKWSILQLKGMEQLLSKQLVERNKHEKKYDPLYREQTTDWYSG